MRLRQLFHPQWVPILLQSEKAWQPSSLSFIVFVSIVSLVKMRVVVLAKMMTLEMQVIVLCMTQVVELFGFLGIFLEFDRLENVEVGLGWNLTEGLGMIRYP